MDFINGITSPSLGDFGIGIIFKVLFFVIFIGYVFYSLFLTLRVRILAETVATPVNAKVLFLTYLHMVVVLIGGILALMLILIA